ncbi:hypothetical protein HG263_21735 [Pseudoalteromonas sp. JBTF-M23]|uniref:Uncharacterized protein n=1 Tax=Pseudoalteromonas caenipelagi TaxID=2726988 RepID=A0A849VIJ9_9GAMM|nr:hypothetical protein [Pseudoalteromonas caenipelagi]NOU53126.1 hypothetical protein [Pseudoalteromonas caenipelagi]
MSLFNPNQSISSAVAEAMLLSTKSHTGRPLILPNVARSIAQANSLPDDCAKHLVTEARSGSSESAPSHQLTDQE